MTPFVASLSEIGPRYGALFCDLWGCLHDGVTAFPDAVTALQGYRRAGGRVILVTNAPRPRAGVIRQLGRLGVPGNCWDDVATSGDAAQFALVTGAVGRRVHHIGPPKDESFFTEFEPDLAAIVSREPALQRVALDEAEGIVCTGLFDELGDAPEDYRARLLLAKTKGLKLLCANPDIVVDMGEQRMWCAGALAALYDQMGGESLYFGKPHPPIYDLARRRLAGIDPGLGEADILCVGDGIDTDVKGGVAEGLDTLFLTGGLATANFGPAPAAPDLGLLEDWLSRQSSRPTYAMAFLR